MKEFKYHKICKCCGKPFDTNSPQKLFCDRDHYLPCPVCGKLVKKEDRDFTRPAKCCSIECATKLRKSKFKPKKCEICGKMFTPTSGSQTICSTCLKHHENLKLPQKLCAICGKPFTPTHGNQTICKRNHYLTCPVCGKRYIHNSTSPSLSCSHKCASVLAETTRNKTNIERYGTIYPTQNEKIKEKTKQTNLVRYGAYNPMSNSEISKKSQANRKSSYKESLIKSENTLYERYSIHNPMESQKFVDKITEAFIARYGVTRAIQVPEFKEKMKKTMTDRYGVPYYVQSEEWLAHSNYRISKVNKEFKKKLDDLGISSEFEFTIGSKSYDIHILNSNVLIEIDPTYTHSIVGNHWNKDGIPSDYHLKKTKLANAHGYRVIHVFDWDNKEKIIQSLMPKKRVYARQCAIYMLKPSVARQFTAKYHLQGSCRGQAFCLGLVKDDELLEVMTFGNPRYNKKYDYELLRLCTKFGYEVIGGASKLFSFATKYFEISNIISYCDYSKFNGLVYSRMGMTLSKITPPQEVWSRDKQFVSANLLRERGYDQLFGKDYGKGASNELLMLINGWLPVFDCGQKVFEYKIDA